MLGQNTSAHYLQKVGQITWVGSPDYLPGGAEYLGTAKSGGQNTCLGAAKSGAEYLGAAKSEADYLG